MCLKIGVDVSVVDVMDVMDVMDLSLYQVKKFASEPKKVSQLILGGEKECAPQTDDESYNS